MDQKNMNLIEEQNHQVCKRNEISNFHLATSLGIGVSVGLDANPEVWS